jgi:hypothetical protein
MYDRTYSYWWGTDKYNSDDIFTSKYQITNIPIFMNIYGFLPLRNMSLYAYIGPSINIGSFSFDGTEAWTDNWDSESWYYWNERDYYTFNATATDKAKCTAIGFQGGLGIEINLGPFLAIGLEGYGRYVNFSNWTGTSNLSWNSQEKSYYEPWGWWLTVIHGGTENIAQATLYDYDSIWSYTGNAYNYLEMFETGHPPSGPSNTNVHPAAINFNAIGALFSIIIHF